MGIKKNSKSFKKHGNGNIANAGGKWIRTDKRRAIYLRDGLRCVYCGKGIEDGIEFTLDHLVCQELGGDNKSKNLVTACKQCNCSRRNKTLRQFFAYLRDQGVDTEIIRKRIKRNTSRKLKKYRDMVKGEK